MNEDRFETILTEPEAVERAMAQMKDNDLVVILADEVNECLATVRKYSAGAR